MGASVWIFLLTAIALPLVLAEAGDWAPWAARRIASWAARRLGKAESVSRYESEWHAELNEIPGKLSQLGAALGFVINLPRMVPQIRMREALKSSQGEEGQSVSSKEKTTEMTVDRMDELRRAVWGAEFSLRVRFEDFQLVQGPLRTFTGTVTAMDILDWYETYGEALFQENIRSFLGERSESHYLEEVIHHNPELLWHTTNGVTLLAQGGAWNIGGSVDVSTPSVISGASTILAISRALRSTRGDLTQARVQVRVCDTADQGAGSIQKIVNAYSSWEGRFSGLPFMNPRQRVSPATWARRRRQDITKTLISKHAISDGTELKFISANSSYREAASQWIADDPNRGVAEWDNNGGQKPLRWQVDGKLYSVAGLALKILQDSGINPTSVFGPRFWVLDDGTTLAEVADRLLHEERDPDS
ncbi:AIPR family protein [Glycomyces sp. NRRL B-16210]|uniref:AIPR family protein n=1 Tax=Glycomyces sp. NRRL B-16210 TaxID=1463821 RepID=UPI00106049B2|nr:AIPR family protein [Glycomyces sp. NRRL B-16210]